jgi:hypothetical protein
VIRHPTRRETEVYPDTLVRIILSLVELAQAPALQATVLMRHRYNTASNKGRLPFNGMIQEREELSIITLTSEGGT